ncbi:hypothetical protein N7532_003644 [Penicillium argentinense]|uniref:Uncharacterized protein n=1 Tax=Penicillium argentinense TaxID=1131581 RepID=A0A9W9FND4_9EURO|nr:uncharacterized protein N7532_003644 [Penicillium argentinense]KAJ5103115.1 hypothetical protein N7532_003644 [Penicillium argentinense]
MQLSNILTFLALSSGAYSFKIRAFTGDNCSGTAKEINVWDNTCRDSNTIKTRSFRVLSYGGYHQRAQFWESTHCYLGDGSKDHPIQHKNWWADGGSDTFKKDKCINLGYTSQAYNSYSG